MKKYLIVLTVLIFCLTSCVQNTPSPITPQPTILKTENPTITPPQPTFTQAATEAPTPQTFPFEYKVKVGDTLYDISKSFGVPLAYIAVKNDIKNVDLIYPDQVLIIPDPDEIPSEISKSGKRIVVVLSLQKLYAFEEGQLLNTFVVSTGRASTPTVLGEFSILSKLVSTTMSGPGYYLEDVRWTMYFFEDYGIHGTYWHNNFGTPMSHGCVNMKTDEAEWLFNWAPEGTSVTVLP